MNKVVTILINLFALQVVANDYCQITSQNTFLSNEGQYSIYYTQTALNADYENMGYTKPTIPLNIMQYLTLSPNKSHTSTYHIQADQGHIPQIVARETINLAQNCKIRSVSLTFIPELPINVETTFTENEVNSDITIQDLSHYFSTPSIEPGLNYS